MRPTRPPRAPSASGPGLAASPWEFLAACVLGAVVALGLLVWAAGQLAALMSTGQWPAMPPAQIGGVLLRLPDTLTAPAAAWPPDVAALIPGPWMFWTVFTVVAAAVGSAAWWVWRRHARRDEQPQPAAWASRRDLRPLRVAAPTPGRLTLGHSPHGGLLAAEARQSVIVFGPSQSGKTTGLAIPAIIEWDGPVIATSVKKDLVRDTLTQRQQRGTAWVYDPTASLSPDTPTARWTPLDGCRTWQGAQATAAWLTTAARDPSMREADFWYATAAKLLAPLLFAAATSQRTMADVVRWVDTQEEQEVRFELELAGVPEAVHAAEASWQREDRQRSSVYTTTETILAAFADPAVAASATASDLTADTLLDGGSHTLYVCAPSHEQARLRPVFTALLQQLITAAYRRAGTSDGLTRPLLIVLDEAANIAPLPDLDTIASTAAGVGIQLLTVWQDLAQIHTRYGDRAATVVNNHRAKLALSGISDPRTLDYFSRLTGDTDVTRTSTSRDPHGATSTTEATQRQRLAPDHALRQLPRGHGLLVYGALPTATIALRNHKGAHDRGL